MRHRAIVQCGSAPYAGLRVTRSKRSLQ